MYVYGMFVYVCILYITRTTTLTHLMYVVLSRSKSVRRVCLCMYVYGMFVCVCILYITHTPTLTHLIYVVLSRSKSVQRS